MSIPYHAPRKMTDDFTVVELIRAHGCEPFPSLSWACGNAVRDAYVIATGFSPHKALRPKTTGIGTHCHAVYPVGFRSIALSVVVAVCESHHAANQRQLDFQW